METFRLFLAMFLQICTAGAMEMNRCHQSCIIGYEFCEPQKEICRQCSDFDDYCFKDNLHISNCSTYCKEKYTTQDTCSCNKDLWIGISTGLFIIVICLTLGPVIYRRCRRYRKMRQKLSPSDTTSTADEKEQETSLMTADTPLKDIFVRLHELEEDSNGNNTAPPPNGCVTLNQVSPSNVHAGCAEMSVSGKTLNPRDID